MSLCLFNAVPVGAIETLFLDNQPWFKRADLGRYLGIAKIGDVYRDITTTSRHEIGGVSDTPLKTGQNDATNKIHKLPLRDQRISEAHNEEVQSLLVFGSLAVITAVYLFAY